ncbi:MAG: hypothetical protein CSA62_12690 [Planctomycetota bacterium]|nr:MAG: hypothetical protein CSA62_12690 [Planctomycetota bacterium]
MIDQVRFEQLDRLKASHFPRPISWRDEKGSAILTPNMAATDWPEVLTGDEAMAAALLDRPQYRPSEAPTSAE